MYMCVCYGAHAAGASQLHTGLCVCMYVCVHIGMCVCPCEGG